MTKPITPGDLQKAASAYRLSVRTLLLERFIDFLRRGGYVLDDGLDIIPWVTIADDLIPEFLEQDRREP